MQQSITLPYFRPSAIHIPRRDMVLARSDSLTLQAIVVERDHPSATTLDIPATAEQSVTGTYPAATMVIWGESYGCCWHDYARPYSPHGTELWRGVATRGAAGGSFDFFFPAGTLSGLPPRCDWAILLVWEAGTKDEMLARGKLHIWGPMISGAPGDIWAPPELPSVSGLALMTDDYINIHTDSDVQLETS